MSAPASTGQADRERIKELFIAERGYWRPWTETMLQACPGFVEQYARYAGYPARTGPLSGPSKLSESPHSVGRRAK